MPSMGVVRRRGEVGCREASESVLMERWAGKVAIVTGASAGIGRAVACRLAAQGLVVAAVARRKERLEELSKKYPGKIHAFCCDVTDEEAVVSLFRQVETSLGPCAVLVNNAGTAYNTKVAECDSKKWRTMFDLNVLAVGIGSREALASMKRNRIEEGYIINIGSISAHGIPEGTGKHIYNATKHALRVITEGLRQELAAEKSKVKVSTISPGVVETEIFEVGGWTEDYNTAQIPFLNPDEIAKAAVHLLSTPLETHIADIVVRPLGERVMA